MKEFRKFLEKYSEYRNLSEEYKTDKFLRLYLKIYNYSISIPKEKFVSKKIHRKTAYFIGYMFSYISHFLEAKDFYHWKERIYSLYTEKLCNVEPRKYQLYYGSNWKKYYISWTKNISNKVKDIWTNRSSEEIQSITNKRELAWLEKDSDNIRGGHSKQADEMCEYIDKYFGYPEESYYFIKNQEYILKTSSGKYYMYDYVNTKYKFIVEFDGVYWHGLLEGQEYVFGKPVEEVWKRDKEKEELAIQNGYKVFHIRDTEYFDNKSKCLENLLKEIENYVHSQNIMI